MLWIGKVSDCQLQERIVAPLLKKRTAERGPPRRTGSKDGPSNQGRSVIARFRALRPQEFNHDQRRGATQKDAVLCDGLRYDRRTVSDAWAATSHSTPKSSQAAPKDRGVPVGRTRVVFTTPLSDLSGNGPAIRRMAWRETRRPCRCVGGPAGRL